jgi:hypothetical protein
MSRFSARPGRWLVGSAVTILLMGALVLIGGNAQAAKGGTCEGFTATVGGQTFTGETRVTIPAGQVGDTITLTGTYVTFSVVASTFETRNYTLTGVNSPRPDKDLPLDAPSVVFTSKLPQHGDNLNGPLHLRLSAESVVLERAGARQDMKIQAKDCAQGGLFQMEPEPGTTYTHTLGVPEYTGESPLQNDRLCWRTPQGGWTGYDSPELAALDRFDAKTSDWTVQSGGRLGMVIGEDAVEGGCT